NTWTGPEPRAGEFRPGISCPGRQTYKSRSTAARTMQVEPVTLEGDYVRLKPLSLAHHAALCAIGLDEDLWRWTNSRIRTSEEMRAYLEAALRYQAEGTALPFVTIEKKSGTIVGSTSSGNIDRD